MNDEDDTLITETIDQRNRPAPEAHDGRCMWPDCDRPGAGRARLCSRDMKRARTVLDDATLADLRAGKWGTMPRPGVSRSALVAAFTCWNARQEERAAEIEARAMDRAAAELAAPVVAPEVEEITETPAELEARIEALPGFDGVKVTAHDGCVVLVGAMPGQVAEAKAAAGALWCDWLFCIDEDPRPGPDEDPGHVDTTEGALPVEHVETSGREIAKAAAGSVVDALAAPMIAGALGVAFVVASTAARARLAADRLGRVLACIDEAAQAAHVGEIREWAVRLGWAWEFARLPSAAAPKLGRLIFTPETPAEAACLRAAREHPALTFATSELRRVLEVRQREAAEGVDLGAHDLEKIRGLIQQVLVRFLGGGAGVWRRRIDEETTEIVPLPERPDRYWLGRPGDQEHPLCYAVEDLDSLANKLENDTGPWSLFWSTWLQTWLSATDPALGLRVFRDTVGRVTPWEIPRPATRQRVAAAEWLRSALDIVHWVNLEHGRAWSPPRVAELRARLLAARMLLEEDTGNLHQVPQRGDLVDSAECIGRLVALGLRTSPDPDPDDGGNPPPALPPTDPHLWPVELDEDGEPLPTPGFSDAPAEPVDLDAEDVVIRGEQASVVLSELLEFYTASNEGLGRVLCEALGDQEEIPIPACVMEEIERYAKGGALAPMWVLARMEAERRIVAMAEALSL